MNVTHFNASNPGLSNSAFDNDSRITRGMTSFALENHYEKDFRRFELFLYNWGRHKINDGYQIGKLENRKITFQL